MAALSLGKLDAICARLKSSQDPLSASAHVKDKGKAQDAKEEIKSQHCDFIKCGSVGETPLEDDLNANISEVATDANIRNNPGNSSQRRSSQNVQGDDKVIEKAIVQSSRSDHVLKPNNKDESIINKHNSINNNNIDEAADYNNEIDSSFQSQIFNTADSTTVNAEHVVSSTTAEPTLCNEDVSANHNGYIPVPSTTVQSHSNQLLDTKSEKSSFYGVFPQPHGGFPVPHSPSSSSTVTLLKLPFDSVLDRTSALTRFEESSYSREPDNTAFVEGIHLQCSNRQDTFINDGPVNSVVTSTQVCHIGSTNKANELIPCSAVATSDDTVPSSPSSSSASLLNPVLFSSPVTFASNVSYIKQPSKCENSVEIITPSDQTVGDSPNERKLNTNAEGNTCSPSEYTNTMPEAIPRTERLSLLQDTGTQRISIETSNKGNSNVSSPYVCNNPTTLLLTAKGSTPDKEQSSQRLSLVTAKSSERRKSRKSAKPQKQVTRKTFADPITEEQLQPRNPEFSSSEEHSLNLSTNSGLAKTPPKCTPSPGSTVCGSPNEDSVSDNFTFFRPNVSSPLDLSFGNSSSQENDMKFDNSMSPNNGISFNGSVLNPVITESKKMSKKFEVKEEEIPEQSGTSVRKLSSDNEASVTGLPNTKSPVLDTTDSRVLVDFANNTMKELLGIYGFEGADSKTVSLQNYPSDALAPFSANSDDKSPLLPSVKEKVGVRPRKKSKLLKSGKSGSFPRTVYTSLALPSTKANSSSGSTKSSDDQDPTNFAEVPSMVSSRTIKYAFSKKSYTQKVLNSADFSKFIRRYGSGVDCGGKACQDLGYKDHYHCLDCPHKVFLRKEETVRHYKWHKKRNDSLQHGFMRYSPMDDCSKKHGSCTHNGRQTHYHCVQGDCDKVYVSTSDVQMHANFHRKDSAIIQEGFQRFRATEDCGTTYCSFYGQRTTHFHCRRPQCNFTFKNKADMEKHKGYHQKDEVLIRDGFKKFMKYEACPYTGCRYSRLSNHIHCIRPGCLYVLHSTAQLYSHKRKHERREFDQVYRTLQHNKQSTSSSLHVKGEALNGVKALSTKLAAKNNTKVLPLPSTTVPSLQLLPRMSLKASSGSKLQGLQLKSTFSTALTNSITRKTILRQNLPIDGSLILPKKPSTHTSVGHVTEPGIDGVLNLTRKGKEANNNKEELRQTLTLPVKLLEDKPNVAIIKLEPEAEADTEGYQGFMDFNDEPEDLSLPKKENKNMTSNEKSLKVEPSVKLEPDSENLPQLSETIEYDDEDDDSDDDDDDDDDKDYGQVEEPTLVNPFSIDLDGNKLNDSLKLVILKPEEGITGQTTIKTEVEAIKGDEQKQVVLGKNIAKAAGVSTDSDLGSDLHGPNLKEKHHHQQLQTVQGTPQAIFTPKGKVQGVNIPVKLPERRERDETWKKHLIRYTANDACYSRCACLYKDHYHCRTAGCLVIFKSKDGVRGHARFHELQDSITPLVYLHYKSDTECASRECPHSGKEEHFHCNWANCTQVILASAPVFSRLEHYRIHEYATSYANKTRSSFLSTGGSGVETDPLQKRRGRPPKYPKFDLPVVPKVHLTEKEIVDSTLAFIHNKCSEDSKIVNGFKKFSASETCPDDQCIYRERDHFHCGRKYCHMSTDRLDVLNLHAKDFHNNITILDGYEFFERMVNCRRPICHNNKVNRHFHCMRPRCDYSFVRHSTMSQHNKKHPTVTSAVLSAPASRATSAPNKVTSSQFVPIAPAVSQPVITTSSPSLPTTTAASANCGKTVKSSGTFFPLSGIPSFKFGSLSSPSLIRSNSSTAGTSAQVISNSPLTPIAAPSATVISGPQVFHTQGGATIFSTGTILTLPHNLITTSIPLLTQSANGPQASLLTGLIPVGQLSQHGIATPLVNISGGQLIAAPQAHVLQPSGGILGTGVLQVIQNPSAIAAPTTSTSAGTISTFSGSTTIAPSPSTAPPVTLLLQQPQVIQQESVSSPINWANLKKRMHYSVDLNCGRPFCKLKKKEHYHCLDCNQAFSDPARLRAHVSKHGFKFKTKDHGDKKQVSSGLSNTKGSLQINAMISKSVPESNTVKTTMEADTTAGRNDTEDSSSTKQELSLSLNLQPSVFTRMVKKHPESSSRQTTPVSTTYINGNSKTSMPKAPSHITTISKVDTQQNLDSETEENDIEDLHMSQISNNSSDTKYDKSLDSPNLMIDDGLDDSTESSLDASSSSLTLCFSLSRKSSRKRTLTKNEDFVCSDSLVIPKPAKQKKIQFEFKSENELPEGYKRVRCGEDCGHTRCAYRQTVTHFHCVRADCGYGFSDKSRIIQHRVRHQRLDALIGDEFQQYRASVSCDRADCEFNEKASHFHCLKCPYSCADSSKVPAHRKYHAKLDNISSNGFIKYAGTADCQTAACSYFRKQTHYHCTFPGCGHSVLGPSQMAPHKLKHGQ